MNLPARLFLAAVAAISSSPAADTEVYDLAKSLIGKGAVWGGEDAEVRLAPGEAGELDLKLPGLPPHEFLKVAIEIEIPSPFFRMNDTGAESEERLQITSADGRTLFDASFSNGEGGQSFPDRFGGFVHKPGTGARDDDRYRFELVFPHRAETLELAFRWKEPAPAAANGIAIQINGLAVDDSAYKITRLRAIAIAGAPAALDKASAGDLLDAIAGENAMAANRAANRLIAIGEQTLPFIRERFTTESDPDIAAKIKTLTDGLRSDEFKVRATAEAKLGKLGPEALPELKRMLADPEALSADVRHGLEIVKTRVEKADIENPTNALANRLRPALALLTSEEARSVEKLLPAVRKIERFKGPGDEDEGGVEILGGKLKFDFNFGE